MSTPKKLAGFLGEWLLWIVANIICLLLPLGTLYVVGHEVLHWTPWRLSMYLAIAAALTSTWGSWATLIWTRSRALRTLQQAVTTAPAVLMLLAGCALFYAWPARWFVAAALILAGLGNFVASVVLCGGLFTKNQTPSRIQYLLGAVAFPVTTTLASGLIASLWYWLISSPSYMAGWKDLFSVSTLMSSVMAMALISTMIPAAMSRLAQQVAMTWAARR